MPVSRRAFTTLAGAGIAGVFAAPILARATGVLSEPAATGQRCFGFVTDLLTGVPVRDATITASPRGEVTHTDPAGIYSLDLQPGPFALAFEAAGYIGEQRVDLFLAPGQALQIDFAALRQNLTEDEQQRAYDTIVKQPESPLFLPSDVPDSGPATPLSPVQAPYDIYLPNVRLDPTSTPTPMPTLTPSPTLVPTPITLRFPLVARPPLPTATPTRTPTATTLYIRVRSQVNQSIYWMVDLETYVKGVVPNEVPSSWPAEALKAQAVAARSYGWSRFLARESSLGAGNGYVWDGTSDQVFTPGTHPSTTDAAVDATRGQVGKYAGAVIGAFFFSRCNGVSTKSSEDAILWNQNCARAGWNYVAYCRAVTCWGHEASTMSSCGYYGHGVGMCQWGAYARANEGWNYAQIVNHYYTGISIQSLT